jgi:hypothetical protein
MSLGAPSDQPPAFSGRFPATDPRHHHAIEGFAQQRSRTSFAPETIATRRNEHDRTRQIFRKINTSNSCPAAHNGLVGGSSPPEAYQ